MSYLEPSADIKFWGVQKIFEDVGVYPLCGVDNVLFLHSEIQFYQENFSPVKVI